VSLADLVLSLADNKQLLGLRYGEWATRAPTLEADIAAAAMSLDDLGHSRVLYGCVDQLGPDPRAGEGEPSPARYRSVAYLDRPWTSWSQFVAANAVLDTAFSVLVEALAEGDVEVLRTRLPKMTMEERYHFLHGRSWLREGADEEALARAWREAIELFGPADGELAEWHRQGAVAAGPGGLLDRLEERMEMRSPVAVSEWSGWDPVRRRSLPGAIDEQTFAMLRGLEERRFMPAGTGSGSGQP
jgi:ring-1,2-phenylacetyl-CoA epoxidase subunit PaaC